MNISPGHNATAANSPRRDSGFEPSHRADTRHRTRLAPEDKTSALLPFWIWGLSLALAFWGTLTVNPTLTPFAIILLPICAQLLWRRGEPPALVFACAMQWLQAAAGIFYANYYEMSLAEAFGGSELETATWLSLIAVFVLAVGMRVALFRCRCSQHRAILAEGLRMNIGKLFVTYLFSFGIASTAIAVAFGIPGLGQAISAIVTVKWIGVFLLAYCVMEQRAGYGFLAIAVVLEFGVGVLGYFANFKSIFFILLVVALSSPLALYGRRVVFIAFVAASLFTSGVVWTAIKSDYREFLNQGSDEQAVLVSVDERMDKLQDVVANFTWEQFNQGLEALVLRVGYVHFFAMTMIHVPDATPYENGALWLGALKHIVMPRLFFPEKASLNDSDRTTLYTGIQVAGTEQGTSIGIGYVAESYVDFGPVLMFVPIVLLGVFHGLTYRAFVMHSRYKLIGAAIATSILVFGAYTIETSNIKIVGGNVTVLIVMSVFYFAFGRQITQWLTRPNGQRGRLAVTPRAD